MKALSRIIPAAAAAMAPAAFAAPAASAATSSGGGQGQGDGAGGSGRFLYVQTGKAGIVDEFAVAADGSLTPIGSVSVPGGAGGEGIAAA